MSTSTELEVRGEGERLEAGFMPLAVLEEGGIITRVSLRLDDPDFPYEKWRELGRAFGAVKRTTSFLIGDWLNFGDRVYGDLTYNDASELTGLTPETLMNYASVCRKVARRRRREALSFAHHQAVASMEPQEQIEWLTRAEEQGWFRADLRREIAESRAPAAEAAASQTQLVPPVPPEVPAEIPPGPSQEPQEPLVAASPPLAIDEPAATVEPLVTAAKRLVAGAEAAGQYYLIHRGLVDDLAALVAEE